MRAGAQGKALAALGASSASSGWAVGGMIVGSADANASAVSALEGTTDVAVAVGSDASARLATSSVKLSVVAVSVGMAVAVAVGSVVLVAVSVGAGVADGVSVGHSGLGVGFHTGPGVGSVPLMAGAAWMGMPLVLPLTLTTVLATHPVSLLVNWMIHHSAFADRPTMGLVSK